jgi:hypothetical protein
MNPSRHFRLAIVTPEFRRSIGTEDQPDARLVKTKPMATGISGSASDK